jgi:hypothetical protein
LINVNKRQKTKNVIIIVLIERNLFFSVRSRNARLDFYNKTNHDLERSQVIILVLTYRIVNVMNIIIIIIRVFLRNQNAKRELRTKIKKYLHRVNIVENSKTLALLRNTIALFDQARTTTTNSLIVNDSTLHSILQSMQTTIESLQRNDSRFKSKNYTKILRIVFESIIKSVVANRSINFKTTKQAREFTILTTMSSEKLWRSWSSRILWIKYKWKEFEK